MGLVWGCSVWCEMSRLAGFEIEDGSRRVEGRGGRDREREWLLFLIEADEGRGVVDEVATVFAAGAGDAFQFGERFGSLFGAVDAALGARGGDAANGAFTEVVVGRHVAAFQKQQQVEAMFDQTRVDPRAVLLFRTREHERIQVVVDRRARG